MHVYKRIWTLQDLFDKEKKAVSSEYGTTNESRRCGFPNVDTPTPCTGVRELRRGGPGAGLQADQPEQTCQRRHPRGHVQADLETRHVVGARDTWQMGLTFVGREGGLEMLPCHANNCFYF